MVLPRVNICQICNREFVAEGKRVLCNSCGVTVKRMRNKVMAVAYLGGECKECGFKGNPSAFAFHHRDSDSKEFNLSCKFDRLSWKKLKEELDKCDLVCVRCHNEKHSRYSDLHLMSFVKGDDKYWERHPWFDSADGFSYLQE
jgi:predicted RNA-binding Zn-ribbon protein involved in translation (DUF1610 family)